jgi:endonuclease/exonuclease/phosphatase family metal-dependent hydrolase
VAPQRVRVLAWNLFHGRSRPPARHELAAQFAAMLAGWDWDVALLQEVPPWWPERLARCAKAQQRTALTSRNALLPLRRMLAEHRPELIKSNGGGANAILARATITEHRGLLLRSRPERRVAQLARLACGTVLVNYHGSARVPLAEEELERLWSEALEWAGGAPLVLGGDLNLRRPSDPGGGIVHVAQRDVDHIFAHGLRALGEAALLDRRTTLESGPVELSDHPPLLVELRA